MLRNYVRYQSHQQPKGNRQIAMSSFHLQTHCPLLKRSDPTTYPFKWKECTKQAFLTQNCSLKSFRKTLSFVNNATVQLINLKRLSTNTRNSCITAVWRHFAKYPRQWIHRNDPYLFNYTLSSGIMNVLTKKWSNNKHAVNSQKICMR